MARKSKAREPEGTGSADADVPEIDPPAQEADGDERTAAPDRGEDGFLLAEGEPVGPWSDDDDDEETNLFEAAGAESDDEDEDDDEEDDDDDEDDEDSPAP
jgi:hypothetical protein